MKQHHLELWSLLHSAFSTVTVRVMVNMAGWREQIGRAYIVFINSPAFTTLFHEYNTCDTCSRLVQEAFLCWLAQETHTSSMLSCASFFFLYTFLEHVRGITLYSLCPASQV